MIADLYYDYLHTGDARPLRGVFYHNEIDVVSMAALLNHISTLLTNPVEGDIEHGLDLISIGKLYADLGHPNTAAEIYRRGLSYADVQQDAYWKALEQLSFLHKKQDEINEAMRLWQEAAEAGQIYAHVEIAKVYEHRRKDYTEAAHWTQVAIDIISTPNHPAVDRAQWLPELEHRLERLTQKQLKIEG
jgi:tetratricopeptide (TPR) repeat protein